MRPAITAALSALAVLVTVSVGFAQNGQSKSDPSYARTHDPVLSDDNGSNANGLTADQEDSIPYRPCTVPLGWVNGRLQCRND
jgi:hypothetical protein